jgi:hypothetical protein
MDDFAAYRNQSRQAEPPQHDIRAADSDLDSIFEDDNPGRVYTSAPKEAFKLGYFDVMCLVLNRMIGKSLTFHKVVLYFVLRE